MSLLVFLVQLAAAVAVGGVLLRLVDRRGVLRGALEPSTWWILALGTGMGTLGLAALGLLAAGWLRWWQLPLAGAAAAIVYTRVGGRLPPRPGAAGMSGAFLGGLGVFALGCGAIGWESLSPALMVDSYMYHILVPKQWVAHGRLASFPYDLCSNYNLLVEAWTAWGFAWRPDDVVLPKLTQVLCAALTGVLVYTEAARRAGVIAGWVTAGLWIWSSNLLEFATDAYIDVSLCFFVVAAVTALARSLEIPAADRRGALVLAGVLFGFAIGTKISGYLFAVGAGIPWLIAVLREEGARRQPGRIAAQALLLGGTAFVVTIPWMLKNGLVTGSPLYPYLVESFPRRREFFQAAMDFHHNFKDYGVSLSGADFVAKLPGQLRQFLANVWLLDHNRFVVVGVLGLLLRLYRSKAPRGTDFVALVALFYLPMAFLNPFPRYVFAAAVLLLAVGVPEIAMLLAKLKGRMRTVTVVATGALLAVYTLGKVSDLREFAKPGIWDGGVVPPGPAFTSTAGQLEYFRQLKEWSWVELVESELAPTDRLLLTENRYFSVLIDRPMLINPHMNSENLLRMVAAEGADGATLAERLRGYGVTHVLTADPMDLPALQELKADYLVQTRTDGDLTLYQVK
jgi:hypothetical protein